VGCLPGLELALLVHCGCEAPRAVLRTTKANSRALGVGAPSPRRARVRIAAGPRRSFEVREGPLRGEVSQVSALKFRAQAPHPEKQS
jgi:hypothetical protein